MDQNTPSTMPIVVRGESLSTWLRRAVPAIVESEGIDEAEAIRIAGAAWNRINGDGASFASTPDTSPPTQETKAAPDSANQPSNAQWNDASTWGTPLRNEQDDVAADTPTHEAQPPDEEEDPSADDSAGTATEWYTEQLEAYANALLGQMVTVGHFDDATARTVQGALAAALDQFDESLSALSAGSGESFSFEIAVPPAGFFGKKPAKSAQTQETKPVADDLLTRVAQTGFLYTPIDDTAPVLGYALSIYPDRQVTMGIGDLTLATVEKFIADNSDLWSSDTKLNAWIDSESGQVWLNVVLLVEGAAQANAFAVQNNLPGYIDIAAQAAVTTQQVAPAPSQADAPQSDAYTSKFFTQKGFAGPHIMQLPQLLSALDGNLAIKSLGRGRVGNYLCVWGDPSRKDLSGEFFTPDTGELTAVFDAVGAIPAIYHHAMDAALKSAVVGIVDRMTKDENGLWVEAQIREHELYKRMISPLIEQQKLGWSSGTLPGARQVNKATGQIVRWPIVEASMTPSPCEWRMATQWPITHIKSAYQAAGLSDFPFDPDGIQREIQHELARIEALARQS